MKSNSSIGLLDQPIGRSIFRLALPSVMAMFFQASVSIAEVWYVGQLGTAELAGLALVYPLYMLMTMLSAGALGGVVAGATARALGANDSAGADRIAWNSLGLTTCIGIAVSIFFSLSAASLFRWLGGTDLSIGYALDYSSALFTGAAIIWIFNVLMAILRGSGQMKISAIITSLVVAIQIPLMGVLVHGWYWVPAFGIRGAPIAMLTAFVIGAAAGILVLVWYSQSVRLSRRGRRLDTEFLLNILRSILIASVSPVLTIVTVVVLTRFVSEFGDAALAGYGIGSRLEFLMIPLVFGIGAALTTLVGGNIGASRLGRAHQIAWVGAANAMLLAGSVGVFFAFFPEFWADHFTTDDAVLASAHAFLQIVGPGFCFLALGLSLFFASLGANRMGWAVFAAAMRLVVILIGAVLLRESGSSTLEMLYGLALCGMLVYGMLNALAIWLGAWSHGVFHRADF